MKLWLDDVRPAPDGWTWAQAAKQEQSQSLEELIEQGWDVDEEPAE